MRTFIALFVTVFWTFASSQTAPQTPPAAASEAAPANDVIGRWKTVDDKTGEAKSVVEIFADGAEIKGRIVELINPQEPDPKCTKCEGAKKDQPVQGMEIIWGMKKKSSEEWAGGNILDPKNGKTYSAKMTLQDAGRKLEVRGFLGISLLGRSQTWHRQ